MESIITLIVGIVLIVLGIINTKGNISTLHSYHRKRVKEEDRLPLGKRVGLGIIICGVGLILMAILSFLATILSKDILLIIGSIVLVLSLIVGITINITAIIKYNGGLF
jgi:hypothetical protein